MDKIIFYDKTEIEIKEGASLDSVVVEVDEFAQLESITAVITAKGNLDLVQFVTGEAVTGEYSNLKLIFPLFHGVDVVNGKVLATFGMRKKTDVEIAIDELQNGQALQDGAIGDLANIVSGIVEGGAAS